MDQRNKTKLVNTLMTKFIKLYEEKYNTRPRLNRNTERWGFGYMLDDLGSDAIPTLEYYFTLRRFHDSQDFLKNYHEISTWRYEDLEDEANRKKLAVETKERVEESRKRWQKPSE